MSLRLRRSSAREGTSNRVSHRSISRAERRRLRRAHARRSEGALPRLPVQGEALDRIVLEGEFAPLLSAARGSRLVPALVLEDGIEAVHRAESGVARSEGSRGAKGAEAPPPDRKGTRVERGGEAHGVPRVVPVVERGEGVSVEAGARSFRFDPDRLEEARRAAQVHEPAIVRGRKRAARGVGAEALAHVLVEMASVRGERVRVGAASRADR